MSAPFGNRTRGMAEPDIRDLRVPPYPVIESEDPDVWRKVTASLAGEDRLPVRKLHVDEPVAGRNWSALPEADWSTLRVQDEINRRIHAPFPPPLSIDTPDDFDRDIMDAAEQAHPAPSYFESVGIGLFAVAAGGLAIASVIVTVRLWL